MEIVTLSLSKLISRAAQTQSRILISVDKQSPIICRAKDTIKRFLIGTLCDGSRFAKRYIAFWLNEIDDKLRRCLNR